MLTTIFIILILAFIGEVVGLAFKMTWGILKILVGVILFPIFLIVMVLVGLVHFAIPILVIAGIVALIRALVD